MFLKHYEANNLSSLKFDFKTSQDENTIIQREILQHQCDDCDHLFKTLDDQENHICKIELKNPVFRNLYLQKFIFLKQCSPIFSQENKKEIALLHCDNCWNFTSYCHKLPAWFFGEPLRDKLGILHLKLTDFVQKMEVDWVALNSENSETINLTC